MLKKNRHLFILLILIALLLNLPMLKKSKSGAQYFSLHSAPDDVWNQYFYIRNKLENPEKLSAEKNLDQEKQICQLAIWGYVITSLALVDSNFTQEAEVQLKSIIKHLEEDDLGSNDKSKIVLVRLSLLYNFYEFLFRDTTFHQSSLLLLTNFVREIREREKYFADVRLFDSSSHLSNPELHLSFAIYDKIHQTKFATVSQKWLAEIRKFMQAGMANENINDLQWNIIFLAGINEPLADSLFQKFTNIDEITSKNTELNQGILYATVAARAVQDTANFARLIRALNSKGQPTYIENYLYYPNLNLTENTLVLFAKVCRFYELLQNMMPKSKI